MRRVYARLNSMQVIIDPAKVHEASFLASHTCAEEYK